MHNVLVISKRELRSYFDSPVAYIVVVVFLLFAGWLFFNALFPMGRADMRNFFVPFSPVTFFSPAMLMVILAPAITMRLIAEERKNGSIELLTTMPIKDSEVILGKFFAALALVVAALAVTFVYAIVVSTLGPLDWGPVWAGYLGLFLLSASLIAIGLLCSTFTENQIVAFIVSFVICAALYFVFLLHFFVPQSIAPIVQFVSVSSHLENMSRGVIDSRDVVYYLSLIVGALFLAERGLARQHA